MEEQDTTNECRIEICDFVAVDNDNNGRQTPDKVRRQVDALCEWIAAFWIPGQQKKYPNIEFSVEKSAIVLVSEDSIDETSWKKSTTTALKKVEAEDLGNMDALELKDSIPDEDNDGRGMKDLQKMEKQLSVKVVFHPSGHVLLVGQKTKLAKKCFTMRNILSHFHWRLSGKDVTFGK